MSRPRHVIELLPVLRASFWANGAIHPRPWPSRATPTGEGRGFPREQGNWNPGITYVWGRHYNGTGAACTNFGTGQLYSSPNGWGTNRYWMLVR